MAKKAIARKAHAPARRSNVVRLDHAQLLQEVRRLTWGASKADASLVAAIKAAAGNNEPDKQEDLKRAYWETHIAFAKFGQKVDRMGVAEVTEARRILDMKVSDRDATEKKLFDNARQNWKRLLERNGLKSTGKGAGNANNEGKAPARAPRTPVATDDDTNNTIVTAPIASITSLKQITHLIRYEGAKLLTVANTHAKLLPPEYARRLTEFATWAAGLPTDDAEETPAKAEKKPAPRTKR